eukprot:3554604-Rhodomonas_salina.3
MSQRSQNGAKKGEQRAPSPPITHFFQKAEEESGGAQKKSKTDPSGKKDAPLQSKPPLPPKSTASEGMGSAHNSVPCTPSFSQPLSQTQNSQLSPGQAGGPKRRKRKTFHDCIYGQITFHPLLVAIIDTVEFQRLRKLKQLGTAGRLPTRPLCDV